MLKGGGAPQVRTYKTIWQTIWEGTADQRCRLKEVHIHDVLHALGLNPNAPWPPIEDELETTPVKRKPRPRAKKVVES
jgi:hypothetical protein